MSSYNGVIHAIMATRIFYLVEVKKEKKKMKCSKWTYISMNLFIYLFIFNKCNVHFTDVYVTVSNEIEFFRHST